MDKKEEERYYELVGGRDAWKDPSKRKLTSSQALHQIESERGEHRNEPNRPMTKKGLLTRLKEKVGNKIREQHDFNQRLNKARQDARIRAIPIIEKAKARKEARDIMNGGRTGLFTSTPGLTFGNAGRGGNDFGLTLGSGSGIGGLTFGDMGKNTTHKKRRTHKKHKKSRR